MSESQMKTAPLGTSCNGGSDWAAKLVALRKGAPARWQQAFSIPYMAQ